MSASSPEQIKENTRPDPEQILEAAITAKLELAELLADRTAQRDQLERENRMLRKELEQVQVA